MYCQYFLEELLTIGKLILMHVYANQFCLGPYRDHSPEIGCSSFMPCWIHFVDQ